ncbi:unnamed protein product [Rotaria sp. Silwood2]|nr:unnamed protein product [Rotaria sp. Silwood2]
MEQYMSVLCSVIEKKDYFAADTRSLLDRILCRKSDKYIIARIQTAFVHALKIDNPDVIRKAINGLKILVCRRKVVPEKEAIDILLSLTTSDICNETIKQDIRILLNATTLENNQKCAYELAYLNFDNCDQLLDRLDQFDKPKLLAQNFNQISRIIDDDTALSLKALEILQKCSNKENITDKLLKSIAVLLASTNSKHIKSLCCRLIVEMTEAGRKVTDDIISLILAQDENDKPIEILKVISNNQTISEELKNKIKLFSDMDSLTGIDLTKFEEFLDTMQQEYQRSRVLSHLSIQQLLSLKIEKNELKNSLEQKLIDIYALILIQNSQYSFNQTIIDSVERAILSQLLNKNILDAYKVVIQSTKCQTNHFDDVFRIFIDILDQNNKLRIFHCDILVCIALTLEAKEISELKSLEINIFNDDEIIRYWSFRGLRAAYDRGFRSSTFLQWCDDIINKLEDNTDVEVNFDLDLFETIAALKYIDFDKIDGKPQNRWNRELLICDLIERFYITEAERFQFYEAWLDIEEHRKSQSDILLKLLHRFLVNNNNAPFTECYETVKILDQIDFDTAHDILLHSSQAFVDLRQAYLTVIIRQCLLNRAGISGKYIEALASNMMSNFGFDLSRKFLNSLQSISNLSEFENILNFSKTYHIKLSDIYVKNATVPILKRSLQIKLLGNQIEKADRLKLGVCLDDLLDKNWAFEQLNHFFSIVKQSNSREKERYFLCVLEIISHYKIPSKEENYEKYQQF